MTVYVFKKQKESNDRLGDRFKRLVNASHVLQIRRRKERLNKDYTRRVARLRAIKRDSFRAEREKTELLG